METLGTCLLEAKLTAAQSDDKEIQKRSVMTMTERSINSKSVNVPLFLRDFLKKHTWDLKKTESMVISETSLITLIIYYFQNLMAPQKKGTLKKIMMQRKRTSGQRRSQFISWTSCCPNVPPIQKATGCLSAESIGRRQIPDIILLKIRQKNLPLQ